MQSVACPTVIESLDCNGSHVRAVRAVQKEYLINVGVQAELPSFLVRGESSDAASPQPNHR